MTVMDTEYDVIVIGAGVAGVHATLAAARQKSMVLLLTSSWDTVSCLGWGPRFNSTTEGMTKALSGFPSIALGKSSIYKGSVGASEVDLVDGYKYQGLWKYRLESTSGVTIFQDTCEKLDISRNGWTCHTRWGARFMAKTVVLAIGTFLQGEVMSGLEKAPGGRPGETGAANLRDSIEDIGIKLQEAEKRAGPTINARSIAWECLHEDRDEDSESQEGHLRRRLCWAEGDNGKRIFLEPINGRWDQYYLEGWDKTSNSSEMDERRLEGIEGLRRAKITKPAFSVSYMSIPNDMENEAVEIRPGTTSAGQDWGTRPKASGAIRGPRKADFVLWGKKLTKPGTRERMCDCATKSGARKTRGGVSQTEFSGVFQAERLFLAGRFIGARSYEESAQQGLVAGKAAARVSRET